MYLSLIIPILILFLFVFFAFILPFIIRKTKQIKENKRIKNLKYVNNRILVKLSDCEILTSSYLEEKMRYGYSPVLKILEHKFTEGVLRSNAKEVEMSVVYFKGIYKGKKREFYSEILNISKQSLLFLFEKQKQTIILFG